jgi:hypothetical protein
VSYKNGATATAHISKQPREGKTDLGFHDRSTSASKDVSIIVAEWSRPCSTVRGPQTALNNTAWEFVRIRRSNKSNIIQYSRVSQCDLFSRVLRTAASIIVITCSTKTRYLTLIPKHIFTALTFKRRR